MELNLVTTGGQGLPAQLRLKGWKPAQDLRLARRNAYKYAREFNLRTGECAVITNGRWTSDKNRRFCLVVMTAKMPLICYLPTAKVQITEQVSFQLFDFLQLIYSARQRRRAAK